MSDWVCIPLCTPHYNTEDILPACYMSVCLPTYTRQLIVPGGVCLPTLLGSESVVI